MTLSFKSVVIFFTYGVSLKIWEEAGLLIREVKWINELAKYFRNVYLVTYGDQTDKLYTELFSDNVVILVNKWSLPLFIYSFVAPILYHRYIRRASLYITTQVSGAWSGALSKLLYNKKLVIRHGYSLSKFFKFEPSLIKGILPKIEEFILSFADAIMVTSKADVKYLQNKFLIRNKLYYIPNYVDTNLFKPDAKFREKNRICFVGRLHPQKNIINLIKAVEGTDIKLTIIGNGPLKESIKELIESKGLENVDLLGVIPHDKLPDILNRCEIFVLPSLYEGNPKTLLEAMAAGLPVIATNIEGVKEIINHLKNGYLCGVSSESIRNAILDLLNNSNLKKRLAYNARAYIIKNFAFKKILKRELALYRYLLIS